MNTDEESADALAEPMDACVAMLARMMYGSERDQCGLEFSEIDNVRKGLIRVRQAVAVARGAEPTADAATRRQRLAACHEREDAARAAFWEGLVAMLPQFAACLATVGAAAPASPALDAAQKALAAAAARQPYRRRT